MIWEYIKNTLAFCGVFFGAYLMALAITAQLGSPEINNFVGIFGLLVAGGSILYLLIKVINKLTK